MAGLTRIAVEPKLVLSADPLEAADSLQPGNSGVSLEYAKNKGLYFVSGSEINEQILGIVGSNAERTDGRIQRSLPRCHPQMPFLTIGSINAVGHGKPSIVGALVNKDFQPPRMADSFALYPEYRVECEFVQHDYQMLDDSQIYVQTDRTYDRGGNEMTALYVNEYDRFITVDEKHDAKIITATQGQLKFVTGKGQKGGASPPHGAAFAGTPRIPFPETILTILWHQVPYRYVASRNSFFKRLANHVNQAFWAFDKYQFDPGELLYLGFSYRRWTPPFPNFDLNPALGQNSQRLALEKWVDVTLTFAAVTTRINPDPPQLPNTNWMPVAAAGHNLLPWFGPQNSGLAPGARPYYYVCSFNPAAVDDPNFWAPLYDSALLQMLFMDPDVGILGPGGVALPNPAPVNRLQGP